MILTDAEKQRMKLLDDTRERFRDSGKTPAVHPRYQAAYRQLYHDPDEVEISTLGIRSFLCVIIFVLFVIMDKEGETVMNVSSDQIVEQITSEFDISEVWNNL